MTEKTRMEFITMRDGQTEARAWAERTLNIYLTAISDPRSHASKREYKPKFQASIRYFKRFLDGGIER